MKPPAPPRAGVSAPATARLLGLLCLLCFLPRAMAESASAADEEWTVESSDGAGLLLSWKNLRAAGPSASAMRSVAVALAPGFIAEASLVSSASASGEPLPPASGKQPALSPPARFRDVLIAALTFDPGGPGPGRASAAPPAHSARIRVAFKKGGGQAFRGTFPPPEDGPSEKHLKSWLINYAHSRGLRSAPSAALGKNAAAGPTPEASLPGQRLIVRTLGENIQVLSYDSLRKAGVPLSRIDPRAMRLYADGRETPMYIRGEADGRWDPGDYIEFIGRRAAGQTSYNSFYAERAAFILVWEGGRAGLRAPAVPVAAGAIGDEPGQASAAKAAPPHRVRAHLEEDIDILRIGSTSAEEIIDLGARVQEAELTDFWFWKRLGAEKDLAELPFFLEHTPASTVKGGGPADPALGASLRVTLSLKGITNNPKANPDHHLKFLLNGSDISLVGGVNYDAVWEGQESFTWVSPPLDPSILKPGSGNVLSIQKVNDLKTGDGQAVEFQDAYLNFIELDFPATYAAIGDRLAFSNAYADSTGATRFNLTGFTTDDVSLWDKQGRKLVNYRMVRRGEGFELAFTDSLPGRSDFIACAAAKRETPRVQLDTLDDLVGSSQGADYLVITEKKLLGKALDSLVAFRRSQGLRTRVVTAGHIYQAFGDGGMDPAAIRRFVAHAYANWARPAPTFLLLVGDASQGYEKRGETVVPTRPVNIRGWGVAANDDYYAKVAGEDDIGDMLVGRLPVASKEDLSKIVRKTLRHETERPQGHWSNKALLVAGFESSFTAQNYVLQGIAAGNDRQVSRVDLFPGSAHYRNAAQRENFYAQLDSGFNLVNFIGHGGGSVWSDAGVLTLKAIDEGRLKGEFPIPLVSSITCLTGFFEDFSARSLGEEMLRMDQGGAAGFYGAAGYISNLAGEALSSEILKAATSNAHATTGAIVSQAETMVKLRTGDAFLPILAEFNLLGDPALGFAFPEKQGALTLNPALLSGGTVIAAEGSGLAVEKGRGMATVLLGDSTESNAALAVSGSGFSVARTLDADPGALQNGKVVVHYWDDTHAGVVSAPFTSLDWLIDSVAIEPADAAPGDSVRIRLRLATAYDRVAFGGGVASFVVGGDQAPLFPGENQVGLESEDGRHLSAIAKVLLAAPADGLGNPGAGPRVHLAFRLSVTVVDEEGETLRTLSNLGSRTYSLPLSESPRLELPPKAIRLPIQNELGVWILFHNKGSGTANGFRVSLSQDLADADPVVDTLAFREPLPFGGLDSLFFPLEDAALMGRRLRASLIADRQGDLAPEGVTRDTVFRVLTASLASDADTLILDTSSGTFLTLPPGADGPRRAFVETAALASLPAHLASASGIPFTAYKISAEDFRTGAFLIGKPEAVPGLPKTAAEAAPFWHFGDLSGRTWLKLDSAGPEAAPAAMAFRDGWYALLVNRDAASPFIQFSSRGQVLLPDDYVPLRTPIDVVIRDGEGVDMAMHPPALSTRRALDSADLSQEASLLFPTLARIRFLPDQDSDRDSLTVTARDVSGNLAVKTLAFRMGDDLAIRDLGSYPNPFADTATFVFSLTDYCDKVDLKVYSRAGRLVRALERRNVVGYQEVVWDGRAGSGNNVANGLYFLKVTAKSAGKETSKVFKLFKKQRK